MHWNILPGQIAAKIDENDIASYSGTKGFVVQDGLKAIFFADGAFVGELAGGKYPFKDLGVAGPSGVKKFLLDIASHFSQRAREALASASTLTIVLMREGEFPLVFVENGIPTRNLRSDVALHVTAKISNIIQFYKNQLLDQKFVSVEKLSAALETAVRTLLEDSLPGVEADFDLLAVCRSDSAPSARRFVVIENKFKSMPRREQLEEYRAKVSSGKVKAGRHDERLLRYAQIHACLRSRH